MLASASPPDSFTVNNFATYYASLANYGLENIVPINQLEPNLPYYVGGIPSVLVSRQVVQRYQLMQDVLARAQACVTTQNCYSL